MFSFVSLGAVVLTLAGCGQGSSIGTPRLPLVDGAKVVDQVRRCDEGNHVYCALYTVVEDGRFRSAQALMTGQRRRLKAEGWALQQTEIGQEQSAISPGKKLRMVYATAAGDLLAVDEGWVDRPHVIAVALAHTMFDRTPAISLMVEAGPS